MKTFVTIILQSESANVWVGTNQIVGKCSFKISKFDYNNTGWFNILLGSLCDEHLN